MITSPEVQLAPFPDVNTSDAGVYLYTVARNFSPRLKDEGFGTLVANCVSVDEGIARVEHFKAAWKDGDAFGYLVNAGEHPVGIATILPLQPLRPKSQKLAAVLPRPALRVLHAVETIEMHGKPVNVAYFLGRESLERSVATIGLLSDAASGLFKEPHTQWALVPNKSPKQAAYENAGFTVADIGRFDERSPNNGRLPVRTLVVKDVNVII